MMGYTDRHFRVMIRQISKHCLVYTEMVAAQALQECRDQENQTATQNIERLIGFDNCEKPIALQVGGDSPKLLAEAAKLATHWNYDEINLNVGCPSENVQKGRFGACLMAEPAHVARCVNAMAKVSKIPITVKHRIGIDNQDSYEQLLNFIDQVAEAGANRFCIHARKAWLTGLDPKQNRTIPLLKYELVKQLKIDRPFIFIDINGGFENLMDSKKQLNWADGVMVGRQVYDHPLRWGELDRIIFDDYGISANKPSRIIASLFPYAEKWYAIGGRLWPIARHLVHTVEGIKGARHWRRWFTEAANELTASPSLLLNAAKQLEDVGY
uniref:tRNA-dihydrouridine synthase n=1 Tax=Paulinella chromatophora TaxID=39717 RepID=B1X4I2_PAUCH|nr:hypothetical protein PCC_0411 [Paulinella chromatophora]ACB42851.1 hypothetical protein PCC_0411 [Paulinella chromatophora]